MLAVGSLQLNWLHSDLEFENKLKYVQISFSASTFDRINKVIHSDFYFSNDFSYSISSSVLNINEGPSSQVCRPAVSYRRNHGAPHWLLSHQWGGDHILCGQDLANDDERKIKLEGFVFLLFLIFGHLRA